MPISTNVVPHDQSVVRDWAPALRLLRESRAATTERLKAISEECAASHSKAHVLECETCWGAVIDEIRDRYLGGSRDDEWFSGRAGFLEELGEMLGKARERRVPLSAVEERVNKEKRSWYRDALRKEPYYVNAAIASTESLAEFLRLADVRTDDEIARLVQKGIGPLRGGAIDPEAYLSVLPNPDDPKTREDVVRLLFQTDDGKIPDGAEPYASRYRSGTPLLQVMNAIDADRTAPSSDLEARARRAQDERTSRRAAASDARRRLDELERARTAHTKLLSKKTEEKDKALRPEFFALPVCRGCGGEVERGKVVGCSLCQIGVDMGTRAAQTVYCSMKCCEKAHDAHVQEAHACASGPSCLQHTPSPPNPTTTLCKECASQQKLTAYCSPACASSTLRSHLEAAHPALWAQEKKKGSADTKSLRDAEQFLVGLGDVHSERIGKKVKGAKFVEG